MTNTKQLNLIQAYRQAPWRVQMQFVGLFALVLIVIAIVAGIYLNVTARAAAMGREIQALQETRLNLERDNADMHTQLAGLTAVKVMEERAQELGFRPADASEFVYVVIEGYSTEPVVTLAPAAVPEVSRAPDIPEAFRQSLFDWLREIAFTSDGVQGAMSWLQPVRQGVRAQP